MCYLESCNKCNALLITIGILGFCFTILSLNYYPLLLIGFSEYHVSEILVGFHTCEMNIAPLHIGGPGAPGSVSSSGEGPHCTIGA